MRKRAAKRFFTGFLLAALAFSPAAAEKIQVVKSGKLYGKLQGYRVEDAFYLSAKDASDLYGGSLYWRQIKGQVQLSLRGKQALFEVGSIEANLDGKAVKMPRPMILRTNQAFIPVEFFCSSEFSAMAGFSTKFSPQTRVLTVYLLGSEGLLKAHPLPSNFKCRIAIDAGHGGKDSGATGGGLREKDINLKAARELAKLLKQKGIFDVLLTRDSDVFVPLADRARIANEFQADLFISLHCNAHRSRSETGYEVYFLSEHASDPEAERLAEFENSVLAMEDKVEDDAAGLLYALARTEFINDAAKLAGFISKSLGLRVDLPKRGVKQAAFYVLRGVNAPAILVEMGFVTNSKDARKLRSQKYRRQIVEGVYAGIMDFAHIKGWLAKKKTK